MVLPADRLDFELLEQYEKELPEWFIVSQVKLISLDLSDQPLPEIEVQRAEGTKCERCWKVKTDVGANPEYPTHCRQCAEQQEAWVA